MATERERRIEAEKVATIARRALEKIAHGCRSPESVAEAALDEMFKNGPKQSLQRLLQHR